MKLDVLARIVEWAENQDWSNIPEEERVISSDDFDIAWTILQELDIVLHYTKILEELLEESKRY